MAVVLAKDAQMALHALRIFLQVAAQLLQLAEHQPGMVGESLAGRRERDAVAVAVKQFAAHALLEILDAHARGGQRQRRTLRAAREAVAVGDVDEEPQVHQVEMHGAILNP
jgi:hypothetical protein